MKSPKLNLNYFKIVGGLMIVFAGLLYTFNNITKIAYILGGILLIALGIFSKPKPKK